MILPIYAYGQPVLRKKAVQVDPHQEDLKAVIDNMWETMYNAKGVGLAAPQIGKSIRLFIVDTVQMEDEESDFKGIKQTFINAQKIDEDGEFWEYEEGCLSIPQIRGDVERQSSIRVRYLDENLEERTESFDDLSARVIQHEYDHIEGILFTEKLKPIKKRLIQRKLDNIKKGKIKTDYALKFPKR